MSKHIGQILAVTGANLTIEVDPTISDLHIRHEGVTYTVGQPGTYLIVEGGHDKHLVLVTMVRKNQWTPTEYSPEPTKTNQHLPAGNFPYLPPPERLVDRTLIDGVLVGTIMGRSFEVGSSRLPVVGDSVTLALESHLKIALSPPSNRDVISIGSYVDSNLEVCLDLDHMLCKHTAIVGTTGCGKSYTVARLVQQIINKFPGANIVIFDLHGEYQNCFKPCRYFRADQLSLPVWLHTFEDIFQLCADLSNQFNIHNQRWAFRDGIFQLKQKFCMEILKDTELAKNIDLDAPIPFKFEHLQNYLYNLNAETVTYETDEPALDDGGNKDLFGRRMKFKTKKTKAISGGPLYGELDRLVLRVDSRVRDPRYAFMFRYNLNGNDELKEIVKELSGFKGKNSAPVTVFDLSYLPFETIGTVVSTISRLLFQVHFLSERRTSTPTLVVYEEAHNYIPRMGSGEYSEARRSVERIAKEGRKFGIGTIVVSQRPSELSETLLSQCNTFLCMRLANNADKNYVAGLLPESMNMLIDVLPALPRGHVIAIGQATKMPVRFEVSEISDEKMRPHSEDPEFGRHWKQNLKDRSEPDITKVCEYWVRSEKPKPESDKPIESKYAQESSVPF